MNPSFSKVFELIKKTGDRCVVLPENGDEPFVIMSLLEYERLALGKGSVAALTENELLDKINRDIAVWKSQQEADEMEDNDWDDEWEDDYNTDEEEDPYYFENV